MHNNKQRIYFGLTLLVSFTIHLFILTVLFTMPDMDDSEGYKQIRVKLGIGGKLRENDLSRAEKYASYSPGAGRTTQSQAPGTSQGTVPAVAAAAAPPQENTAEEVPDSDEEESPDITAEIQETPQEEGQAPELQKIMEVAAKDIADSKPAETPPMPESQPDTEESGTIIGNSRTKDAGKLATYEQMLPLWLEKFKLYPPDAASQHLSGSGEVFIKIDRNGKVLLSKVIKSTGAPVLDEALLRMIADADPVLPVPIDYHTDKKTFSYKIAFEFKEPQNE